MGRLVYRPQSSSASRLTAGASEFPHFEPIGRAAGAAGTAGCNAVLPIVRRMVIPVVVVVSRGVVTPVVGVDVGIAE
jgi:hypothetical protein